MDDFIQELKDQIEENDEETQKAFQNVKNDVSGLQKNEHKAAYWEKRRVSKHVSDKNSDSEI